MSCRRSRHLSRSNSYEPANRSSAAPNSPAASSYNASCDAITRSVPPKRGSRRKEAFLTGRYNRFDVRTHRTRSRIRRRRRINRRVSHDHHPHQKRRIVTVFPPLSMVESMELLIEKLDKTRTNSEFLNSMSLDVRNLAPLLLLIFAAAPLHARGRDGHYARPGEND